MPIPTPVVILEGGLGNQLFQFAYGLTLGPSPAVLDNRRRIIWGEPLRTVLHDSAWRPVTQLELLRSGHCPRFPKGQRTAIRYWESIATRISRARILKAETECSGIDTSSMRGVTLIEGYFQDERFVDSIKDRFLKSLRPELLTRRPDIPESNDHMAISFRLGYDYEHFDIVLPDEYYRSALEKLASESPNVVIHVCADDQDRARALLDRIDRSMTVVDHSTESPVEQLRVLASVSRLAISNSSFAWWGAWLGDELTIRERQVIAPKHWLAANDTVPRLAWQRL